MANNNQTTSASETVISVDMNAADPAKAVTRKSGDIARGVRDQDVDAPVGRTKAEKDLFKRMGRLERNLEKQFDQRMAAREAEHQRELAELRQRVDKVGVDRGSDDAADVAHEAAITALKDKLAAANEKGDSAAAADVTAQMSRLDAQFWAKKAAAAGVVQREPAAATTQPTQRAAPASKGPTVAGSRFIRANEDWWEDPEFEIEKAAANTIYVKLVETEGFDPKDGETFKEVAKQLKAKFPDLPVHAGGREAEADDDRGGDDDDADRREAKPARRQAPAQRLDDRGGDADSVRNRGTRRTLTAQEIGTMKACRLDPDNDKDVVTFLREAVALEAQS